MKKELKIGWIATISLFGIAIMICVGKHYSLIESIVVLGMITIFMSIMWWALSMNKIIDRMGKP